MEHRYRDLTGLASSDVEWIVVRRLGKMYKFMDMFLLRVYCAPMTLALEVTQKVMPTAETRSRLSQIVANFRDQGAAAGVVVFGSHRKSEAVIVPIEIFDALSDQIGELVADARLAERLGAPDDGLRLSTEQVAANLGIELS